MKGKTVNLAYFFLILGFTLLLGKTCLAARPLIDGRLDHLLASGKLLGSEDILADFATGENISKVIVTLRPIEKQAPATTLAGSAKSLIGSPDRLSGPASRNLRNESAKKQLRQSVATIITNALAQFDKSDIRVTRRFSYLAGFAAEVTPAGLANLLASPNVLAVEKNQNHAPSLAQGIGLINASTVRTGYTGAGISIALCDTGIDTSHPKLGGDASAIFNSKVIGGYDFADEDEDATPGIAGNAHGTACAGIAAGDTGTTDDYIGGVAPGAKLYSLKVTYGNSLTVSTDAIIAAWEWCVTHQNDDPNNPILVISNSFGKNSYSSACDDAGSAMTTAAANAVAAGITIFAASGNDGYSNAISSPACVSHVNSVGSVYDTDVDSDIGSYVADSVVASSNTASFLTLFAPAEIAYTTDMVDAGGYASGDYYSSFSGTSAACAYAAGAAAVLQQAAKEKTGSYLTPSQVQQYLVNYGDSVTDTKAGISKPRINLGNAVAALSSGGGGGGGGNTSSAAILPPLFILLLGGTN